jgi:hypothetical protein
MKRTLALVLGLVLGWSVWAQPVVQNTITGNEVWPAAQGPGGSSTWLGIDTVRNGESLNLKSGSGAATSTATGGMLFWVGTAPTTWTITLPSPAYGGEIVALDTDTTLTTLVTVNAGAGQTLHTTYNSQTLTVGVPIVFQYKNSVTTWFRIQ